MKKALVLCLASHLALVWIGCSRSQKEQAIIDFVQTVGDSRVDMNVKVLELRKERDMYGMDSLVMVMTEIQAVDDPGSDRREPLLRSIENYTDSRTQLVGEFWFCTYQLKNPLMNNARQEFNKYFMFKGDDLIGGLNEESYEGLTEITNKNLK